MSTLSSSSAAYYPRVNGNLNYASLYESLGRGSQAKTNPSSSAAYWGDRFNNTYNTGQTDFSSFGDREAASMEDNRPGHFPGNAPDQALDDFIALAQGDSEGVLNRRLWSFIDGTFDDPNMSPASGHLGESYQGIPFGNYLTDVSVSKDLNTKVQLLESRIQYVLSYLIGLLEQGPEALAGLLKRRGLSPDAAQRQAMILINEIQRKAPDFVAAAQRAVRQARQRIEGMQQMAQTSDSRTQALNQRLSGVVQNFGGGGGGGR